MNKTSPKLDKTFRHDLNVPIRSRSMLVAIRQISKEWDLSNKDIKEIHGVSDWELSEWNRLDGVRFHRFMLPHEFAYSRLIRLYVHLSEVKDTKRKRKLWANSPMKEIGNKTPIEYLKKDKDMALNKLLHLLNQVSRK